LNEYQQLTATTAIDPARGNNIVYPALGLAGEAGEIANKVKKIIRDAGGVYTAEHRLDVIKELGDVLWYVSELASEFSVSLNTIAEENIAKLASRAQRGTLRGSGDNR
jgi:NTP pyrophosphatase (non-canonical NTP hydrolase)